MGVLEGPFHLAWKLSIPQNPHDSIALIWPSVGLKCIPILGFVMRYEVLWWLRKLSSAVKLWFHLFEYGIQRYIHTFHFAIFHFNLAFLAYHLCFDFIQARNVVINQKNCLQPKILCKELDKMSGIANLPNFWRLINVRYRFRELNYNKTRSPLFSIYWLLWTTNIWM